MRNKKMKRIFALVLCCITLIVFSGCAIVPFPLKIRCDVEEITSIEVYHFNSSAYLNSETEELEYFSVEEDCVVKAEPIAYVEEADYQQFISDAEELPFKMFIVLASVDPSWEYTDYVVKMNWEGDYQLIASKGGGLLLYCEEEAWQNFLKKYIGEEHFNKSQENSQS